MGKILIEVARTMDVEYGGEVGPVARKLSSFPQLQGWVFGAWNEASPDVHNLVHLLAKARLRKEEELQEWGAVARRRRVSIKGSGPCRARWPSEETAESGVCAGPGQIAVGQGSRGSSREEERRMSREQRAHLLALEQGRAVLRRGDIFLN